MLAYLSKHSVRVPGVCLDELRIAAGERNHQIASILLESPDEVSPPISISHIQYLDLSNWKLHKEDGEEVFNRWFKKQVDMIEKIITSNSSFSGEIELLKGKLMSGLSGSSYLDRLGALLKDGFVGRKWIFEEIENWLENDKKRKVFCLTGEPGIGKSAVVAQLASQNKLQVAGVHFCTSGSSLDDPKNVIISLAFQLGTRLPAYRKYLLNCDLDLKKMSARDVFARLITEAGAFGVDGGQQPYLLVIDALDEAKEELAQFVAQCQNDLPPWLYLLVTSRPNEVHVKPHLKALNPKILSASDSRNLSDAKLFIKNMLEKNNINPEIHQQVTEKLIQESNGNFRYLSFVRDMARDGIIDLEECLNEDVFPNGLSSLYNSFMQRAFPSEKDFEKIARPLLSILASCGSIPMSLNVILPVLKDRYDISESTLNQTIGKLGSLIRINEKGKKGDKEISLYHKSVSDWLLSDTNTQFCLDVREAETSFIKFLWEKLRKCKGNEKKFELFEQDHAPVLGRLLFNRLAPGEGSIPDRLENIDCIDKDDLKEIGITKKSYEQCREQIDFMVADNIDWLAIFYILDVVFYGSLSKEVIIDLKSLGEIYNVDKYKEQSIDFYTAKYEDAIREYGKDSKITSEALFALLDMYMYSNSNELNEEGHDFAMKLLAEAPKTYLKNSIELAKFYSIISRCEDNYHDREKSGEYSEKTLKIYENIFEKKFAKFPAKYKKILKSLTYNYDDDFEINQKDYDELEKIFANEDIKSYANSINDMITHFFVIGDYENVVKYAIKGRAYLMLTGNLNSVFDLSFRISLYETGRYEEAIKSCEHDIKITRESFGDKDESIFELYSELASIYENYYLHSNENKEEIIDKLLKTQKKVVDFYHKYLPNSEQYFNARNNYCNYLITVDKLDEADKYAQETYKIAIKDRINNVFYIRDAWNSIEFMKELRNNSNFSYENDLEEFLKEQENYFKGDEEAFFNILQAIIYSNAYSNEYNLASICEKYLNLADKLFGKYSPEYIKAAIQYAWFIFNNRADAEQAIHILQDAINLMKRMNFVKNDECFVMVHLALMHILFETKKYAEALDIFRAIENRFDKIIDRDEGDAMAEMLISAYKEASILYEQDKDKKKSKEYMEKALKAAEDFYLEEEYKEFKKECKTSKKK